MGFREGVEFQVYFSRLYAVAYVLFYLVPLFFILVAVRAIKAGSGSVHSDLYSVWASIHDAWKCGEI